MSEIDVDALAEAVAEKVKARLAVGDDRPLLTVAQLAERLAVSDRYARELVGGDDPVIPSIKVGGARRIAAADVDRYLATRRRSE